MKDVLGCQSPVRSASGLMPLAMFLRWIHPMLAPESPPSVEDVAAHWAEINDETGYSVPRNLMDWSRDFLSHLPPAD